MTEREPHYAGTPPKEIAPLPRLPLHVVLDNIRSAFNVGSMFRTADACAVERLHLCGMSAHPPHPKLDKTALGAQDYVPWTYYERTTRCLDTLKELGLPVVAVEIADGAVAYSDFDWPRPCAVLFGNEVDGVREKILARCDGVVRIPMRGHKNCINVATAFGVILFEIVRRWGEPQAG